MVPDTDYNAGIYTNISFTNAGTITSLPNVNLGYMDFGGKNSKIFYYFVTGTETVITPSNGGTDGNNLAVVLGMLIRLTLSNVTHTTNKSTSSSDPNPPSISPVTSPTMIVVFGISGEDESNPRDMSLTAPSGYTLAAFSNQHNNSEGDNKTKTYKEHTSTNSENPGAFSVNNGEYSIAYTFALRGNHKCPFFPYLVNENLYKADGSKYPDSTIVYGAKNNDGTDVKELQVGVLTNETSSISETALRSYRGFNPGGGDIIYADDYVASATSCNIRKVTI